MTEKNMLSAVIFINLVIELYFCYFPTSSFYLTEYCIQYYSKVPFLKEPDDRLPNFLKRSNEEACWLTF